MQARRWQTSPVPRPWSLRCSTARNEGGHLARMTPDAAISPGGVVACVESLAAEAGAEVLRAGGNATDAAIATAFAQGVVDPIYCGIAGGFHGIFHDASRRVTKVVMAGGRAPLAARPDMWRLVDQWGALWTV